MAGAGKNMLKEIREQVAARAGGAAALGSSKFRRVRLKKQSGR